MATIGIQGNRIPSVNFNLNKWKFLGSWSNLCKVLFVLPKKTPEKITPSEFTVKMISIQYLKGYIGNKY